MNEPILYIDRSTINDGALERVKAAIDELVAFVAANEPQLVSYNFYLNEECTQMTVIALHPDSASMLLHMKIGAPAFRKFADLIRLQGIEVYGRPSEAVLEQLWSKARMLGDGTVQVHHRHAGFIRNG